MMKILLLILCLTSIGCSVMAVKSEDGRTITLRGYGAKKAVFKKDGTVEIEKFKPVPVPTLTTAGL